MYAYAFIASDNGLGHLRRCVAVAGALAPARCVILGHPKGYDRLHTRNEHVDFVPFNMGITAHRLRHHPHTVLQWPRRLPRIAADIIVSDNMPEILQRYPRAVLQGSFMWHAALPDAATYVDATRVLLQHSRPRMIGTRVFGMPEIRQQTAFHDVGLYQYMGNCKRTARTALLLAVGTVGNVQREFRHLVRMVVKLGPPRGVERVYVDRHLMPTTAPEWLQPAMFDCAMFAQLKFAVVRPGLGKMCDLLSMHVPMITLCETDNLEIIHNGRQLQRYGWATSCETVEQALTAMYGKRETDWVYPATDFNGLQQTVHLLQAFRQEEL